MSKIAFRVDGGRNIGMGHIMRTLVLAKELSKSNEVVYISIKNKEDDFRAGIDKVKAEGFSVIEINEGNLLEQLTAIQDINSFDCLITDSYDVDRGYFEFTREIFNTTGYIDDINICEFNVDFIINQNINAKDMKYEVRESTRLFLGTKYLLLREEFRSTNNKVINKEVTNIMVTVGGMDVEKNTIKILEAMKFTRKKIHVIIGSAFTDELIIELEDISTNNSNILLYKNANMSEVMKKCDIAISAGGSTLYELAAMEIPTVAIEIADNQKEVCKYLDEFNVVVNTARELFENKDQFLKSVGKLINDYTLRKELVNNQKTIVNKNGVEILVYKINSILVKS